MEFGDESRNAARSETGVSSGSAPSIALLKPVLGCLVVEALTTPADAMEVVPLGGPRLAATASLMAFLSQGYVWFKGIQFVDYVSDETVETIHSLKEEARQWLESRPQSFTKATRARLVYSEF